MKKNRIEFGVPGMFFEKPRKYKINDDVMYMGQHGKIVELLKKRGVDKEKSCLYGVLLDGEKEIHEIVETLLEDYKKEEMQREQNAEISIDAETKITKINEKIKEIFSKLDINEKTFQNKEENAFKLFDYVIKNSRYDESIMEEKKNSNIKTIEDMEVDDIYKCLCEHRSVCSSDAATLSLMFGMVGIESNPITIANKGKIPSGVHEVVKMKFGEQTFICDPTLVRTSIVEGQIPDVNKNVFAFTPDYFFNTIYNKQKEIKFEHEPVTLNQNNKTRTNKKIECKMVK